MSRNGPYKIYRPEIPQEMIEHVEAGGTLVSFAEKLNIDRSTLFRWSKKYPEFKEAQHKAAQIDYERRSPYKEEFDDMLIKHMAEGESFEAFAAVINVSRTTLYNWVEHIPSFSHAKQIGTPKALRHWERAGMWGTFGKVKNFNANSWKYSMANRFPSEYKDKSELRHEVSGPDGKPLEANVTTNLPLVGIYQVELPDNGRDKQTETEDTNGSDSNGGDASTS